MYLYLYIKAFISEYKSNILLWQAQRFSGFYKPKRINILQWQGNPWWLLVGLLQSKQSYYMFFSIEIKPKKSTQKPLHLTSPALLKNQNDRLGGVL